MQKKLIIIGITIFLAISLILLGCSGAKEVEGTLQKIELGIHAPSAQNDHWFSYTLYTIQTEDKTFFYGFIKGYPPYKLAPGSRVKLRLERGNETIMTSYGIAYKVKEIYVLFKNRWYTLEEIVRYLR